MTRACARATLAGGGSLGEVEPSVPRQEDTRLEIAVHQVDAFTAEPFRCSSQGPDAPALEGDRTAGPRLAERDRAKLREQVEAGRTG
jgi:hypothetical protein